MTDMESSLKNMILTLLTITLVASLAVGVVYRVTAGPIAEAKAAKITQAIAKVPGRNIVAKRDTRTRRQNGEDEIGLRFAVRQ